MTVAKFLAFFFQTVVVSFEQFVLMGLRMTRCQHLICFPSVSLFFRTILSMAFLGSVLEPPPTNSIILSPIMVSHCVSPVLLFILVVRLFHAVPAKEEKLTM